MAIGALGFWLPDIVWHAIRGSQFGGRDADGITALLPLSFFGACILVHRFQGSYVWAAYDGSVMALLIATVVALIISIARVTRQSGEDR